MGILSILLPLIVVGVVLWAAQRLLAAFGVGDPIATVVYVVLVLLLLAWLAQQYGIVAPIVR